MNSWTCHRCFRIWSPQALECSYCNDPVRLKEWLRQTCEAQAKTLKVMGEMRAILDHELSQ